MNYKVFIFIKEHYDSSVLKIGKLKIKILDFVFIRIIVLLCVCLQRYKTILRSSSRIISFSKADILVLFVCITCWRQLVMLCDVGCNQVMMGRCWRPGLADCSQHNFFNILRLSVLT